jgi:hypothetical protein
LVKEFDTELEKRGLFCCLDERGPVSVIHFKLCASRSAKGRSGKSWKKG